MVLLLLIGKEVESTGMMGTPPPGPEPANPLTYTKSGTKLRLISSSGVRENVV